MDLDFYIGSFLLCAALISLPLYGLFIYCSGNGRRVAAAILYPLVFPSTYFKLGAVLWKPFLAIWPGQGFLVGLLGPFLISHAVLVALALFLRPEVAFNPAAEQSRPLE